MGMAIEQEVPQNMRNPLEALTEGTPHRGGKGAGPGHRACPHRHADGTPARERLMEAIGAGRYRTKVKRRKAPRAGKLTASSEARYPLQSGVYWRRDCPEVRCSYPRPSAGFRHEAVGPRTRGRGNR
jgi:hypothetical protein